MNDFPEIEQAARLIPVSWFNQVRPLQRDQNFHEEHMAYVDPSLVDMLDLHLVFGERHTVLTEPRTVLLSKTKARQYFPQQNPVGELLVINDNKEELFKVAGVFEDFPSNSHLDFDFLISMKGVEFWPGEQTYWGANMYSVYALIREGSNVLKLDKKLSSITTNYFLPSWVEREFADPQGIAANLEYQLQPIQDIYLSSIAVRDRLKHGDRQLLWLLGLAALMILIIACINFVNLSMAKYAARIQEVSIRKVLGATKGMIVQQLLVESLMYSLFSMLLGVCLVGLMLPFVEQIAGVALNIPWSQNWAVPFFLMAVVVT